MRTSRVERAHAVTKDPRWALVCARSDGADGQFFFSVKTTGVFCRPSCSSRRPRPENVEFHQTADAARASGFRPCKRCRPERPANEASRTLVAEMCRLLAESTEPPSLAELARAVGKSPFYAHRLFKAATGLTPKAYAAAHRVNRVRAALHRGPTVTHALYEAGYGSAGRFYDEAKRALGMTPTQFKSGGRGLHIQYAVRTCSLGSVLVAATERGVCAILLGDGPRALERQLAATFRHAHLRRGGRAFEKVVGRAVAKVEAPGEPFELPLDIVGTAFQRRVWQALSAISPGTTKTYAQVARELGAPTAARAVARACAANNLAVAIPCHRVVRGDGQLAGYRWGLGRKATLLEREAAVVSS